MKPDNQKSGKQQQQSNPEAHPLANRPTFNHYLEDLGKHLLMLATEVDEALRLAVFCLKANNKAEATRLIKQDKAINTRRYELEEEALSLIALQQPVVTHDLRQVAAVLHLAGELERIGDYAKGIATIATQLNQSASNFAPTIVLDIIEEMGQKSRAMLLDAVTAFNHQDVEAASEIAIKDDELDVLYNEAYHELLKVMLSDSSKTDEATKLLAVVHNLERTGDRVVNICERLLFVVTGRLEDFHSPDDFATTSQT